MTDFYLFLDLETTDLDPRNLTVLEAAWTVTDADFQQLTPLTSRYTYIPTSVEGATRPTFVGWDGVQPVQVVQNMHKESGLHDDWIRADHMCAVVGASVLDDAIAADVFRAGWQKGDMVYLAGAGVSHFDRLVMDAWNCELTTGSREVLPLIHYRAADVSSAISLLGIKSPKTVTDLFALTQSFDRKVELGSCLLDEIDLDTDCAGFQGGEDLSVLENVVVHRAAPDVAWGLVLSRCLRAMI